MFITFFVGITCKGLTDPINTSQNQSFDSSQTIPQWQAGMGMFFGSVPHYPASNHFYELLTPLPLFVYRFDRLQFRGSRLSYNVSSKASVSLGLFIKLPLGSNSKSTKEFPSHSDDPNKRIITEDNFHRRGMDKLPALLQFKPQFNYQLSPHAKLNLPLGLNLNLNNINYRGYQFEPELIFNLKPLDHYYNVFSFFEWSYGDSDINKHYYQVQNDDALPKRPAYQARAGEIERSYGIRLAYNYRDTFKFFLVFRHIDYSHSANSRSPLHVTSSNNIIATGLFYYFYSSDKRLYVR